MLHCFFFQILQATLLIAAVAHGLPWLPSAFLEATKLCSDSLNRNLDNQLVIQLLHMASHSCGFGWYIKLWVEQWVLRLPLGCPQWWHASSFLSMSLHPAVLQCQGSMPLGSFLMMRSVCVAYCVLLWLGSSVLCTLLDLCINNVDDLYSLLHYCVTGSCMYAYCNGDLCCIYDRTVLVCMIVRPVLYL